MNREDVMILGWICILFQMVSLVWQFTMDNNSDYTWIALMFNWGFLAMYMGFFYVSMRMRYQK